MKIQPMHSRILAAAIAVALATNAAAAQTLAGADRFVGNWVGVLATPNAKLRLALAITRDSLGNMAGVMTSLDQANAAIPGRLTLKGDTLIFAMPTKQASFTGVISAAKDSLHGSFVQGISFPLDMVRGAATAAITRPQVPKPPFPYRAQDVSFTSVPGVQLAGTILLPPGDGPFPAVVLVTGSGPENRDEEIFGHKPFLVIADYLARHGIASLRYDDRGTAKSTGNFAAGTSADFAVDAEAAGRFLRTQPGIARDRVGIIGHSEGGTIAPMVATRSRDVAFIVLLSGTGIPGDSLLLLQQALIATISGVPPALIKRSGESNARLFDAIKASHDSADAAARITDVMKRMVASLPASEQASFTAQLDAATARLLSPWMQYFIRYDPRPTLRKVHVPVLALGGTLDLQVPYKENLGAIDTALKAAGNHDVRIVSMPGLNHLFQTATTGGPAEYPVISETFSPAALELIGTWINERFATPKPLR
jgi:pimeloyl-ACP methyl ester carboxylesterase